MCVLSLLLQKAAKEFNKTGLLLNSKCHIAYQKDTL